jgi:hypothetical protein
MKTFYSLQRKVSEVAQNSSFAEESVFLKKVPDFLSKIENFANHSRKVKFFLTTFTVFIQQKSISRKFLTKIRKRKLWCQY